MLVNHRARRCLAAAATVALALFIGACAQEYPNTTFARNTEFGSQIDDLWDRLLFWGTIVFVFVEIVIIFTIIRFRQRRGAPAPKHVHGNTLLEITWTLIPAVILVFIAVPTVRTIFATQADPPGDDVLQVEVIGHQWWWEFRYPQYGIVTANELYVPIGRTVNFALRTADVLHSFWVPQMGGKRDLISNRTNYLWFTPSAEAIDSATVFNGVCVEYCGSSHANMRFRMFTVTPEQFDGWVALQQQPAQFGATPAAAPALTPDTSIIAPPAGPGAPGPERPPETGERPQIVVAQPWAFPDSALPPHAIPATPIPDGLTFSVPPESGDPERGREVYSRSACIGCHVIKGNPSSVGLLGPTLTHIATRTTIGAGLFPNRPRELALWIKNAPKLKPGSLMPPMGQGERDPRTGAAGNLTDQQIADIVAYLNALR